MGQWDRALKQLNVARDLDDSATMMAQTYQEALSCEVLRQAVFAGERSPLIFGEPEPWIAPLIESLRALAKGEQKASDELRQQAFDDAPATSGQLTLRGLSAAERDSDENPAESFDWIADADPRFGPVFEAIINGRYYWVPYSCVQRIDIDPPADLRDFVWLPAHFCWTNGGEVVGLIPTRYPGSEAADDDAVRLARRTDWVKQSSDLYFGLGQRIVATDGGEFSLMDIAQINLNLAAPDTADTESDHG
jgi:type VI secretion system protein ImpE